VKRIKPVSRIVKIEAEINRIFGEFFSKRSEVFTLDESWIPCVDISERESEVVVEVELPGVDHRDITLLLHNNRLEIKGVKKEPHASGGIRYHRLEREYGAFRRFVFLPSAVVPEACRAIMENGILTIRLKKPKRSWEKGVVLKVRKPSKPTGGSHG